MKSRLKLIVYTTWVLLNVFVIGPFTPLYISSSLATGGTIFLQNLMTRYLTFGNQGLKFWKRMPPDA